MQKSRLLSGRRAISKSPWPFLSLEPRLLLAKGWDMQAQSSLAGSERRVENTMPSNEGAPLWSKVLRIWEKRFWRPFARDSHSWTHSHFHPSVFLGHRCTHRL